MKKLILSLGILLTSFISTTVAYAGTLNQYEQEVIAAAKGQFEYNGKVYEVDPAYISELTNYFMEDSRDLTKEKKDEALQMVNSYLEMGVEGGYLIPVENNQKGEADDASPSDITTDTNSDNLDEAQDIDNSGKDNLDNNSSVNQSDKNLNQEKDGQSNQSQNNSIEVSNDEFLGGLLADATKSNDIATSEASKDLSNIKDISKDAIKATGFDLNSTVIIAAGIGVIMLTGMIVTIKFNYFAQKDE